MQGAFLFGLHFIVAANQQIDRADLLIRSLMDSTMDAPIILLEKGYPTIVVRE